MISIIGAPYGTHRVAPRVPQLGEALAFEMEGPACLLHLRIPLEGIAIHGWCGQTDHLDERRLWEESLWLAWCFSLEAHPHPMLYARVGPASTGLGYSLSRVEDDQHFVLTRERLLGVSGAGYQIAYSQDNVAHSATISGSDGNHVSLDHNLWRMHQYLPAKGPAGAGYSVPPRPPIPWRPDVVSLYSEFSLHSLMVRPLPSSAPLVPRDGSIRRDGRGSPPSPRPRGER